MSLFVKRQPVSAAMQRSFCVSLFLSLIMSGPYILLQFGEDPFSHRFEDLECRPAFTVYVRVLACHVLNVHIPFAGKRSVTVTHVCQPVLIFPPKGPRTPQHRPSRPRARMVSTTSRHHGSEQRLPLFWSEQDARVSRVRKWKGSPDGTPYPSKKGWKHVRRPLA